MQPRDPVTSQQHRAERLLSGVRRALALARDIDDPESLLRNAGRAAVDLCGFDRCIVFTVADMELVALEVCFGSQTSWAQEVLALGQSPEGRAKLDAGLVESDMLRRRMAAVVPDAQADPNTARALVEATKTRSYVAAPIICEDRVTGFLHADRYFADRPVDEIDREALASLACGFGFALDRAVLHRHLTHYQAQIRDLGDRVLQVAGDVFDIDTQPVPGTACDGAGARVITTDHDLRVMFTAREREVLDLLATGASNGEIARRLVITEGTAKSHVHRILGKLGVRNRAEAVSRWSRAG